MTNQFIDTMKRELSRRTYLIFSIFVFFLGAAFAFLATSRPHAASAGVYDGFRAGNIISDAVMANYNSMTVDEIQAFLTKKNPCDNTDYELYKDQSSRYKGVKWHWTGDEKTGHFVCLSEETFGEGVELGVEGGQTAAEIIYSAAIEHKINPQVLIVLLEKEQGLISDTYPHSGQYKSATGYGCPDTAACDSRYFGFKNQVDNAAALFRYTLDNGSVTYPEKKSGVYIAYHPSASCGSSEVLIENRATAALYRYTPYQPNVSALAAGIGQGNSCASYGNRNFYYYFTKWFGSTQNTLEGNEVVLPDGIYGFSPKSELQLTLGRLDRNAELSADVQLWQVSRDSSGLYSLLDPETGLSLDIFNADTTSGTNLQLWSSNNTCAQKWRIYETPDGSLTFESACMRNVVIEMASAAGGANLSIGTANNSTLQKWQLRTDGSLAEGTYEVSLDSVRLGVADGALSNGKNVNTSALARHWQVLYDEATDTYTLGVPATRYVIDVSGGIATAGRNIQLWNSNSTCAQHWKALATADGGYTFVSACSAGVALSSSKGNIQLAVADNSATTHLVFTESTTSLEEGTYTLASAVNSSFVLDLYDAKAVNGKNIQLWSSNGTCAQKWNAKQNPDGTFTFFSSCVENFVLDLYDAKAVNGKNIQLWSSNGTCAQKWNAKQNPDGTFTFFSSCVENFVLDLYDAKAVNGKNIQLWSSNGTCAQKWWLRPISTP